MKSRLPRRAFLSAAAATPGWLIAPDAAAEIPTDEPRRYQYPTPGSRIDTGGAILKVKAPQEEVMAEVLKYHQYDRILSNIKTSKVLEKSDGEAKVYLGAPIMKGLVTVWGQIKFTGPFNWKWGGQAVTAAMEKGNVKGFHGAWKMHPCGACTVLRLEMYIDLKVPVPASLVTEQLGWACAKGCRAVRDMVLYGESRVT